MSNRLEEIKNEYARNLGFEDWEDIWFDKVDFKQADERYNEVMKLYAKECCKSTLEAASKNAEINKMSRNLKSNPYHVFSQNSHQHDRYVRYEINLKSIVQESNIVIL